LHPQSGAARHPHAVRGGSDRREREVAALVAEALSNKAIAIGSRAATRT